MEFQSNALQLNPTDNVAVTLRKITRSESIVIQNIDQKIVSLDEIPYGHKIALKPINHGEEITKYGECMGIATEDIPEGGHVHVHNVRGLHAEERMNIINKLVKTL